MAYAVGEVCSPSDKDKDDEESLEDDRWHPTTWNTYEVVTAWVHPRLVDIIILTHIYLIASHVIIMVLAIKIL